MLPQSRTAPAQQTAQSNKNKSRAKAHWEKVWRALGDARRSSFAFLFGVKSKAPGERESCIAWVGVDVVGFVNKRISNMKTWLSISVHQISKTMSL